MSTPLSKKIDKVKCLLFDVDGVLTNGQLFYNDEGIEGKSFNVKDGLGIKLAQKAGYLTGIITARNSKAVAIRAEELELDEIHIGKKNKTEVYQLIKEKHGLEDEEISYMGDDLIDLKLLLACGFAACPSDAVDEVKSVADFICKNNGGQGAVREFINYVLTSQNKYQNLVDQLMANS
jgi:3-deoxy-D-manno-octulosonate 8-phosphate phosphatase (KDO 8-P phosphatase)